MRIRASCISISAASDPAEAGTIDLLKKFADETVRSLADASIASGVVTVRAPETGGGQPSVVVDYKCYVFDRYNWDSSGPSPKGVELLGFDISDKRMGGLHTAGYAQEFNMFGTSSVQHYEGVVPTNGAIDFPEPPDSRKGDRTDPTR